MTAALLIGTLLAVGALAFVLYPIFFGDPRASGRRSIGSPSSLHGAAPSSRPGEKGIGESDGRESAIVALREIEFDQATGKLSDDDYRELKDQYTRQAILAMRRADAAEQAVEEAASHPDSLPDDEIEAAVRAYRAGHAPCPECGPRPESDAAFCSNCGRYLRDRCADCGAPVVEPNAHYCASCGNRLAA